MKVKDMNKIFKYFTLSYWITRNKYKEIIKWIKSAKKYYISDTYIKQYRGMCFAFHISNKYADKSLTYDYIQKIIPEFNPIYLNAPYQEGYWWALGDIESRIKAFDKLIHLYKTKLKEL